jgi:hypothetical protein
MNAENRKKTKDQIGVRNVNEEFKPKITPRVATQKTGCDDVAVGVGVVAGCFSASICEIGEICVFFWNERPSRN